jgi:uncharacterized membrane protein YfcA
MLIHWLIYLIGGTIAGVFNAVAGGGSILLFPTLMALGLPAITANTTMSVIVQPGTYVATYEYRKYLRKVPKLYFLLLIPCAIGSLLGAILLVGTPNDDFEKIAPVFMAMALALIIFQPALHKFIYKGKALKKHHFILLILIALTFLMVSAYGGYFGAGFGIIVLSLLGLTPLKDIQQMNGLKNAAGIFVGTVDCAYYQLHHLIDWHILPLFIIGNLCGGYFAAAYSSKLPQAKLRVVITVIAAIVTAYLVYKFYTK